MASIMQTHKDTSEMGQIISEWNYHDQATLAAPAIFQVTYLLFALKTFEDELGKDLTQVLLGNAYFWQERLLRMIEENDSPWFDDISTTDKIETRDDLFLLAALDALDVLKEKMGSTLDNWEWGKIHTIEYVSPIRRNGFGKGLLGSGKLPVSGSSETLLRNFYNFSNPFNVVVSDAMRMVVDLGDPDKVLAAIPTGVCGRLFHPHAKDQIGPFIKGEKVYWWFSDAAIQANAKSALVLKP